MKFLSDILAKAGLTVDGVVTLNNTATGQTPDANDNSTKLATTAWVRTFVQPYSLPIASASILGGIKVGTGLSIDSGTGILSVTGASASSLKSTQTFVVTEGQTVFTVTNGYSPGLIDIFLNGVYLSPNQSTATNGSTFTLNEAPATGDIIDVIVASPVYQGTSTTTDQLPEGVVNLYYTNARARAAISLTTTGVSGAATYNSSTGVFNIPNYQGLVPSGGIAGDILAKVDGTNYNVAWIPNYTSQVQHYVKLGATMTAGTAVYVSGSTGGSGTNMIVSKASNASEATSSKTLGLLKTGGITNDEVFVVTEGLLAGLDTSTANAGDPVWLGVNGALIFGLLNKPTAPAHLVFIGVVTRVQSNNGEIFVKVQNGFELDELHNLSVASPSDGDMIKYVASTGLWTKIAASTTNIVEGTNLYYTQGRFDTAFAAKSTTNLAEGTNLYYTDARVGTYLTNNSYATQTYVNTAVSNLVDAAPGTLDTLNELAAALGDDPNFATTVATSIGTKQAQLNGTGFVKVSGTTVSYDNSTYYLASNPNGYITGISFANVSAKPTTIAGYGITDSLVYTTSTYSNPSWITALAWSKITGAPAFITGYTETDTLATVTGRGASTSTTLNLDGRVNIGNGLTRPSALNSDSVAHARIGGSDVHLYVASLGVGGGYKVAVQAARTSDFASFDLDLQSNGGTLRYGGNEVATRTWVTSQSYLTGYTETDTLASVTGRGASTSTAISINNTLTVTGGRVIARTGGANTYGVFSGYDNSNHMMTFRASVTGSTDSPTFTAVHQTTFVEYAEANDTTGWFFKSASTGTYQEIARITRTGINWNGNTVIHAGNIGSYTAGGVAWGNVSSKPDYIFYYSGFTLDADTMPTNSAGFTYSVNAPLTGTIARLGEGGYSLQLNTDYYWGSQLYFRGRNGDLGVWRSWKRLLNADADPYAANMNQNVRTSDSPAFSSLTVSATLNLPNAGLISVNSEPDTWGARFRTTTSTTNLGAALKNIIWTGGGSNEGFAVTGSGTGGASFEVRNDGRAWFKGDLTAQSNMYVLADGSSGYVASRIWLYSHNNYRGAGIYMSGTGSTWFAGTGYTDFDGAYIISRRSVAGDDSTAWNNYRLWQVNSGGSTYQTGDLSAVNVHAYAATGKVVAGTWNFDGMLFDSSRSALIARGNYPHVEIWSDVSNSNHGGTLRFGGYDNGSSGAYKSWNIGAPGSDLYFLDIGYGGNNSNPHAGIAGLGAAYSYPGAFTIMRFHNNGNIGIGNFGTYGSEGNTPSYKLDVRGTGRFTGALYANTSLAVGGGGDALSIDGAQGRITFRDQALLWTGYVGFRGNLGVLEFPGRNVQISCGYNGNVEINTGTNDYLSGYLTVPYGSVNARRGFTSDNNPWGTSNSSFHPNGITTAGGTNWIYGLTYLGNAPSNGSGAEVAANGRSYFRSSNTSGVWGFAGQYVDRSNAANNYVPFSFENEWGNHSWGIVARFHIQTAGQDKPAIQFTSAGSNDRWSIGYCTGSDFNFRITQNHGYRTDNSGQDGWGTERFRINTDGNTYCFSNFTASGDVTAYSDIRVKSDIQTFTDPIEKIKSIRGVTFKRNDTDDKDRKHLGVVAQEVMDVLPEVISETDKGLFTVAYGNMAGLFIEAIKEQQAQIESQKSEIEELKDLVKQLINR